MKIECQFYYLNMYLIRNYFIVKIKAKDENSTASFNSALKFNLEFRKQKNKLKSY